MKIVAMLLLYLLSEKLRSFPCPYAVTVIYFSPTKIQKLFLSFFPLHVQCFISQTNTSKTRNNNIA